MLRLVFQRAMGIVELPASVWTLYVGPIISVFRLIFDEQFVNELGWHSWAQYMMETMRAMQLPVPTQCRVGYAQHVLQINFLYKQLIGWYKLAFLHPVVLRVLHLWRMAMVKIYLVKSIWLNLSG